MLPLYLRQQWTKMARDWEEGQSTANLYEYENESRLFSVDFSQRRINFLLDVTVSSVHHKLVQEEAQAIKDGNVTVVHREVTPSEFMLLGLNLEDGM
jgi:hypothetical protein